MKRRTFLYFLLIFVLLLIPACGKQDKTIKGNEPSLELKTRAEEPIIPEGPCNNVLYPLSVGNNWIYETQIQNESGQPETSKFTWSVSEGTDNDVVLGTLFNDSGVVLSSNVDCSDGAIQNFPMSQMNMILGDVKGDIKYEFVSGVFMPSLKELEAGNWQNSWDTVIKSSGLITANFEGESTTIELADSPITMHWQILEKDVTVDVPAGSFNNAVKINQNLSYEINSLKMSFDGQPVDISTTMVLNTDMWFAPYIGLLKTEVKSISINLYGTDFPLDPIGSNVLISSNLIK